MSQAQIEAENRSYQYHRQGMQLENLFNNPRWANKPVVILGGGPSITTADFSAVAKSGYYTIGINKSFEVFQSNLLFFMDYPFYEKFKDTDPWKKFSGFKVAPSPLCSSQFYGFDVFSVWRRMVPQVSQNIRDGVYCGSNSGLGALMLAVALNCNPIYLLGYDLKVTTQSHWHSGYGVKEDENLVLRLKDYKKDIDDLGLQVLKLGYTIINLSPDSALEIFPKQQVKDML
jgi:hypothetical protein